MFGGLTMEVAMRVSVPVLAVLAAALATGPAVAGGVSPPDAAAFRAAITVAADDLEPDTLLSTRTAHARQVRLDGGTWGDGYLVARIDRRSGAARYEVHQRVRYIGQRRDYAAVHYRLADGTLAIRPIAGDRRGEDVCSTGEFNGACPLTSELVFPIEEGVLAAIVDGGAQGWDVKFKEADGDAGVRATVPMAEIRGLMLAVADYRAGRLSPRG